MAKAFDESMMEPVDNSNYGKDVVNGMGGAGRKARGGQHRAPDGKYEAFGTYGRKGS